MLPYSMVYVQGMTGSGGLHVQRMTNGVRMGKIMVHPNFMDKNQDSPVAWGFCSKFGSCEALWCGMQVILLAATRQLTMLT